mmetsp:Transcript_80782/g.142317  ORF Transcript_80782/g.142317 Transcript_80782/m.142317 type:complete len:257 (+) Transcript_80782:228-998(+)
MPAYLQPTCAYVANPCTCRDTTEPLHASHASHWDCQVQWRTHPRLAPQTCVHVHPAVGSQNIHNVSAQLIASSPAKSSAVVVVHLGHPDPGAVGFVQVTHQIAEILSFCSIVVESQLLSVKLVLSIHHHQHQSMFNDLLLTNFRASLLQLRLHTVQMLNLFGGGSPNDTPHGLVICWQRVAKVVILKGPVGCAPAAGGAACSIWPMGRASVTSPLAVLGTMCWSNPCVYHHAQILSTITTNNNVFTGGDIIRGLVL